MLKSGNPLEVWLGDALGKHRVGWLPNVTIADHVTLGYLRSYDSSLSRTERHFALADVNRRVDRYAVESAGANINITLNVLLDAPGYAAIDHDFLSDDFIAKWRVLMCDEDAYEWVFDHPDFEAVDTEPDQEQLGVAHSMKAMWGVSIRGHEITDGSIAAPKLSFPASGISGMKASSVWLDEATEFDPKWFTTEKSVKNLYEAEWPSDFEDQLGSAVKNMTSSHLLDAMRYGNAVPSVSNTALSASSASESVLTMDKLKKAMALLR